MRKTVLRSIGLFATASALLLTGFNGTSVAAGEETGSNNLSFPTIMVGGGEFTGVNCPAGADMRSGLLTPSGDPTSGYEVSPTDYYFVQGLNVWQAQCYTAPRTKVTAQWGDNLTGSAQLKANKPIRVELALFNAADWRPPMDGYTVIKLEPSLLDRESAYGTLATGSQGSGYEATPVSFTYDQQVVHDGSATFWVKNKATGAFVVAKGTTFTAEINATGKVVYGYNLRVPKPGKYAIWVHTPNTRVLGVDAGTFSDHRLRLVITVS